MCALSFCIHRALLATFFALPRSSLRRVEEYRAEILTIDVIDYIIEFCQAAVAVIDLPSRIL
jgi:hypothetical protein